MKKTTKYISLILLVIISLVSLTACGGNSGGPSSVDGAPSGKTYRWRLVTHQMPGTSRYEDTIMPFVKAVEEASGGRLIIEPYGAGILFPVSETLDAVKNGMVEMSASWDGNWAGKDPLFALAGNLPADPIADFSEHFYRSAKLDPILNKAFEKYGVTYLGPLDYGPLEILMSTKPINDLNDFKNLNIRTAGIGGDLYSKLGASVVSVASNEIYTSLQLGTVDAAEYNDWIVNMEMGFDEVTKYVIEPVLHTGAISDKSVIVNNKAWNDLPDDLKAIVKNAMQVAKVASATAYDVGSIQAKEKYLSKGAKIIQLSDEDVALAREKAAEVILQYAGKNELTKEFVDTYIDVLVELGYTDHAKNLGYKGK